MAINKVNFSASSEDLADIYISQEEVTNRVYDGSISENALTQDAIDAIFSKSLWSWGRGTFGELGLNSVVNRSSPVQVGALTNWKQVSASGYLFFAIQRAQSLAVKTDGTLWSWGSNLSGNLGLGNVLNHSSPVQVGTLNGWTSVSAGANHSHAVKTDGTLWSWGAGGFGRLGLNSIIYRSSPVQVGALTDWALVSASLLHSLAVKTDGTLWSWGAGGGRLGLGNVLVRSSPVQVGTLTGWASVSAGFRHTLALKTDGTLWSWGDNIVGALGLGNNIYRSSPVQVGSLTNWKSVAAGGTGYFWHSLAVKTDGTLWSWGSGFIGALGLNSGVSHSSPVQVGALTGWKSVSAGFTSSTSVKTDGTLWNWGLNANGVLGLNDVIPRSSPVQVGSLTDWASVSSNAYHVLARKA
jgi:alpha-tubulin suppressor-like RCC1 family protein